MSAFNIGDLQKFNPNDYPKVVLEITQMLEKIHHIPVYFKRDIIISFLKDHSLKKDWIAANPALTQMFTSGVFVTGNIESLFESCRWNKAFRNDFEAYIKRVVN